ncbi:MAG: hypothetical protein IKH41_05880, partial [Clostridia bacterium]|nr:hypothetical protein [Clostridia bacterium]
MVSAKWQMASGKWQMGEPDDDTNFGSHVNHRNQFAFRSNKILSYSFGFAKDKKKKAAFLLIYTAAKGEKEECGRATRLVDTAANRKRQ